MTKPPVDLFDQFKAASRRHAPECKMAQIVRQMDADQSKAYQRAMDDPSIGAPSITTVLRAWGFSINQSTVGRHRKRICTCYET